RRYKIRSPKDMRIESAIGVHRGFGSDSLLSGVARIIGSVGRNDFGTATRLTNSNNQTAINVGRTIQDSGRLIESAGRSIGNAERSSQSEMGDFFKAASDLFMQAAKLIESFSGLLSGDKFADARGHYEQSGSNLRNAGEALGNAE